MRDNGKTNCPHEGGMSFFYIRSSDNKQEKSCQENLSPDNFSALFVNDLSALRNSAQDIVSDKPEIIMRNENRTGAHKLVQLDHVP